MKKFDLGTQCKVLQELCPPCILFRIKSALVKSFELLEFSWPFGRLVKSFMVGRGLHYQHNATRVSLAERDPVEQQAQAVAAEAQVAGAAAATAWVQLRRELVLAFKCIYRIARKVDTDNLTPELSFTVSITHVDVPTSL